MPTHLRSPDAAARDYERLLQTYFGTDWPQFDMCYLGVGEDGHTASLFPGSSALNEQTRLVVAVTAPADPTLRLTLTMPVLKKAANIYVLVSGAGKAKALRHVLAPAPDLRTYPAAAIRSAEGAVIWWVDREAAPRH